MRRSSARSLAAPVLLALLLAPAVGFADDGAALYDANCAMCHGPDGRAQTPAGKAMKAKSLVNPKWAKEGAADALIAAFHANPKHKPVAAKVTDDDLRLIAVHVRGFAPAE